MYDGSSYFNGAYRSLPSNCSTDVRALVTYADEVLSGEHGEDLLAHFQDLNFVASYVGSNLSETYNLSLAGTSTYNFANQILQPFISYFQSYGPSWTTRIFCDALQSYTPNTPGNITNDTYISILTNPGNSTPSSEGFLAQNGNNLTLGLEAYFYALRTYITFTIENLVQHGERYSLPPDFFADQSAWQYTVATQFGWYQGSDINNITIVSRYRNVSVVEERVHENSFSNATIDSLPAKPDTEALNNEFGGWHINTANTMFTDGEFDPWRAGTVFSLESQLGAPGYQPTTEVPACGKQPANQNERFGIVYPGAVHVPDLREIDWLDGTGNNTPLARGVALFAKALDVWLPCFGAEGANGEDVNAIGSENKRS